ncbi:uncharacterized protein BT62DRAFT_933783 [Guyanagaster necrorhizus]|uniref:Uncharacterized protein n=1 Tax=Guyanagaster necrorhizus TaxID=856835 RepID=A0A9P7VP10_9AGAR|nr:uncharacterized protein BT62DRAFT_933783 [Guyanagaster necrorhizus MCA 3950]KAG7444733.1 hypothetical protein BT62DRAFT_933783 [Guyanagaster necrorhizus MCA 3950]
MYSNLALPVVGAIDPHLQNGDETEPSLHTNGKRKRDAHDSGREAGSSYIPPWQSNVRVNGVQNQRKKVLRKAKVYESSQEMLDALRICFMQEKQVDFSGSYIVLNEPPMLDKHRVQLVSHDVWRTSGYRFTVKDHPRTKDGHKTRLWCTQDDARQNRKGPPEKARTLVTGEVVAKTRYPCHSRLLISSRDTTQPNHRMVTVRIHHYAAHAPYHEPPPGFFVNPTWPSYMMLQPPQPQVPWMMPPQPLPPPMSSQQRQITQELEYLDSDEDEESDREDANRETPATSEPLPDDPLTDSGQFQRQMRMHINNIRDFCDGLEYQLQFNDHRLLHELEKEGGSFLRFVHECLRREGRLQDHDVSQSKVTTPPSEPEQSAASESRPRGAETDPEPEHELGTNGDLG